jgi:hypothetical protein
VRRSSDCIREEESSIAFAGRRLFLGSNLKEESLTLVALEHIEPSTIVSLGDRVPILQDVIDITGQPSFDGVWYVMVHLYVPYSIIVMRISRLFRVDLEEGRGQVIYESGVGSIHRDLPGGNLPRLLRDVHVQV